MLFIYNYIANGATTYPGLHNHTAVPSKEYASPTHLVHSISEMYHPPNLYPEVHVSDQHKGIT